MATFVRQFGTIVLLLVSLGAQADVVADWADTTTRIATDGPNTVRTMALAQNAVYEAVNAITSRYPRDRVDLGPTKGASIDAAVAAASRSVLLHEAPALNAKTEAAYRQALDKIPGDEERARGIGVGERAAAEIGELMDGQRADGAQKKRVAVRSSAGGHCRAFVPPRTRYVFDHDRLT